MTGGACWPFWGPAHAGRGSGQWRAKSSRSTTEPADKNGSPICPRKGPHDTWSMRSLHAMDMRVLVAGLSLVVLIGGCSTAAETATTAPADQPTTTTTAISTTSSVVERVPTEDELYGIWWLPSWHIFRWNADGSYAIDDDARLMSSADDIGTFVLRGSTLTMESGADTRFCEEGDVETWEVQLLDDGILFGRPTESTCTSSLAELHLFRVSPSVGVECDDEMAVPADAQPHGPATFLLPGIWLVDCGPRLVHVSVDHDFTVNDQGNSSASYAIDDQGRLAVGPADSGLFEQDHGTLTFTSGADSEVCDPGSMLVIEDPVFFDAQIGDADQPGPFGEGERPAFHGNVIDDGCGRMSGPTTWIRLSR